MWYVADVSKLHAFTEYLSICGLLAMKQELDAMSVVTSFQEARNYHKGPLSRNGTRVLQNICNWAIWGIVKEQERPSDSRLRF